MSNRRIVTFSLHLAGTVTVALEAKSEILPGIVRNILTPRDCLYVVAQSVFRRMKIAISLVRNVVVEIN